MDLTQLSEGELENSLLALCGKERAVTLEVLYHLIEIENRGTFREAGYSSLFDYCTRKLKYSEAAAYKRINAARCVKEFPELAKMLKNGEVSLCTILSAAQGLKAKTTKPADIVGKSKREVEAMVLKFEAPAKPKERIVPVIIKPKPSPIALEPEEERVSITFSLSKEDYAKFQEATRRLSNSLGKVQNVESVLMKLVSGYLKPKTRRVSKPARVDTRYVPRATKKEIYERDGGQCTYISSTGVRCACKVYLQLDHIHPFAHGGRSEASNLRLRCPSHNRLTAENYFGRDFVQSKYKTLSTRPGAGS